MEWTIPAQSFIAEQIQISPPNVHQKPIAALGYLDPTEHITFPCLSLLLPPLPIKSYSSDTGKLVLSLVGVPNILTNFIALQTRILQTIHSNYTTWFPSERQRSLEEITASFQPLIQNNSIHLYCPLHTVGSFNEISIYSDTSWSKGIIPPSLLVSGKMIRAAIRLQSISFHQHPVTKALTGRFRVQHRILALFTSKA
jgi:hypothetical protein